MMKIAVVSDTHSRLIPAQVVKALSCADLIIHAGDICDEAMFKELTGLSEVAAVCGNMDSASLRKKLPERLILQCEGVSIGVMHGDGAPDHVLAHVQEAFAGEQVDAVVFGHSHEPFHQKIGGVLYMNPGSPNDEIFAPYCSYGMIEVNGGKMTSTIIKVG